MTKKTKNLEYYASLFCQVKRGQISGSKYKEYSPYKPIFLLSIIELIENQQISENKINIRGSEYVELKEIFKRYQSILGGEFKYKKYAFHQPFENLINDKNKDTGEQFWHLKLKQESPKIEEIKDAEGRNRIKTEAKLKQLVEYGRFDDELWEILQDTQSRNYLVNVLMDTFFSDETNSQIDDTLNTFDLDAQKQNQEVTEPKNSDKQYSKRKYVVRDSLFRRSIIHIYEYQCAVCRLNLNIKPVDIRSYINIVDAAHIKPLSISYNNQLSNGISLCKNHHWAFDNGCFGIDDKNYSIVVSNKFSEECLTTVESLKIIPMKSYHGQ
ncbi:HNH endonuclease [Hassallia byssoidea VB512170]|uniref:HNH endonuclease n=1 Tax=Hassallia byssoidea VB512170 TaxID=1304833 RepID=A0A846HJ91_9CYAN|nr:HNH endonuclease [Hassalia byssoidea]NEU77103.1 HNH endonuclease [Hassalia byssoidea VB512170]